MKKNDFLLSAPRAVRLMLMVLMCLPMWGGSVLMAQTSEPYAVFDEASGVLAFNYDNKKTGRSIFAELSGKHYAMEGCKG